MDNTVFMHINTEYLFVKQENNENSWDEKNSLLCDKKKIPRIIIFLTRTYINYSRINITQSYRSGRTMNIQCFDTLL